MSKDALADRTMTTTIPRIDPYRHRHQRAITYLLDFQDCLHQRMTGQPATHSEAAELARALVAVRQQLRKERMQADPKPVDVVQSSKARVEMRAIDIPCEATNQAPTPTPSATSEANSLDEPSTNPPCCTTPPERPA